MTIQDMTIREIQERIDEIEARHPDEESCPPNLLQEHADLCREKFRRLGGSTLAMMFRPTNRGGEK